MTLVRGEPINVGYLISKNIKNMANVAQRAYGNLYIINQLCRRVGVPTYPDDEMIGPKTLINASVVRRLQHNHTAGAAQQDQEDN